MPMTPTTLKPETREAVRDMAVLFTQVWCEARDASIETGWNADLKSVADAVLAEFRASHHAEINRRWSA